MFNACLKNDVPSIEKLINEGYNDWDKAMCGACQGGHYELVELILKQSNKRKWKYDWKCVYHNACIGGNISVISLIMKQENVGTTSSEKLGGLAGACIGGHFELSKILYLRTDQYVTNTQNILLNESIFGACKNGNKELIKYLITLGANCLYGLYGACISGNIPLVKKMIKLIDKSKVYVVYTSALAHACASGKIELINLVIKKGNLTSTSSWNAGLEGACQGGHLDIINLMISKGANKWENGLRGACIGGKMDIAKLMIDKGHEEYEGYGMEINFDKNICHALKYDNLELVDFLITKGYELQFPMDWHNVINTTYNTQLGMFKGLCDSERCEMLKKSVNLCHFIKLNLKIFLSSLNIPVDLIVIVNSLL